MKKYLLVLLFILLQLNTVFATDLNQARTIKLPNVNKSDTFLNILLRRKSTRIFKPNQEINDNALSNILWAAYGINRVEIVHGKKEYKRVIPTAMNMQDLEIYAIKKSGTYLYNAEGNELIEKTRNNLFKYFTEKQEFVNDASLILLYTTKDYKPDISAMHVGSSYQNVAIYCAEHGIPNVVKGLMDREGLAKELNISAKSILSGHVLGISTAKK